MGLVGRAFRLLGWNRTSFALLGGMAVVMGIVVVGWWPLLADWLKQYNPHRSFFRQMDWLLLGNFAAMSLLIMARPRLKVDVWILFSGLVGGIVIEAWGTQTNLWHYYTAERPPPWIIPAWPISNLAIDRMVRFLSARLPGHARRALWRAAYWTVFLSFAGLLLWFTRFTYAKPLTVFALAACALIIAVPADERLAVITFAAGSALGFFLERWGTTRRCWIYYTEETPPVFAVVAHGLAAVAFWRLSVILKAIALTRCPRLAAFLEVDADSLPARAFPFKRPTFRDRT